MKNHGRVGGTNLYGSTRSGFERRATHATYADTGTRQVTYSCPTGHDLTIPLYAGALVPHVWECVVHRQDAELVDREALTGAGAIIAGMLDASKRRNPKTHMERVRERRTQGELESLLAERVAFLRARRGKSAA